MIYHPDLRTLRIHKGMRQFDLGKETGINPTRISYLERGMIRPKAVEKARIAKALGTHPNDLRFEEPIRNV